MYDMLSLLLPDLDSLPVAIDIVTHSPRIHLASILHAYKRIRERLIRKQT